MPDPNDMRAVILDFPQQFLRGIEAAQSIKPEGPFAKAVVCGMGGSAMATAEHLQSLATAKGSQTALFVHRNYGLPEGIDGKTLVITSSYSGNTEEVLSAYDEAKRRGCSIVAVTTGGELAERAYADGTLLVELRTKGIPPRLDVGENSAAVLTILANAGIIDSPKKELQEIAAWLKPEAYEAESQELARALKDRIPIVYASDQWKVTARSWKAAFNENAKTPAFWNHFPELNHNELAGFSRSIDHAPYKLATKYLSVIILKDPEEEPRMAKSIAVTQNILREHEIDVHEVVIDGTTPLAKIFSTIIRGQFASYCLATEYGIDPTPIEIVDELKQRLAMPHS
ncbi:bifunctional phosphoglucose/phosphomannose isomerase [Candidatus Parcubacteria bacterium]|nr:bifunctional phosphoglucose/phosphomannose isomerase [Candidatus Parcubacteria bacterium]